MTANAPSSRSSTERRPPGRWACGSLGRSHGLTGELYIDPLPHGVEYLARAERFFLSREGDGEPTPVRLQRTGGMDRRPLVRVEGVDTIEAAKALGGALVLAEGAALDDAGYFSTSELIGCVALCADADLGTVTDVLMNPAHDILEITAADGERRLVPFVAELVDVDLAARVVRVREGLF